MARPTARAWSDDSGGRRIISGADQGAARDRAAARATGSPTKAAPPATAALLRAKIENDELRNLLAASRKAEPEQIADLRRDIERLQAEHARRDVASKVTEAARERVANDPRIARLQKTNSELRKEIAAMREHFDKQSHKQGVMNFKTVSMISKALHPDSKPSDHDRAEAFKAFSGWKADRNAAER